MQHESKHGWNSNSRSLAPHESTHLQSLKRHSHLHQNQYRVLHSLLGPCNQRETSFATFAKLDMPQHPRHHRSRQPLPLPHCSRKPIQPSPRTRALATVLLHRQPRRACCCCCCCCCKLMFVDCIGGFNSITCTLIISGLWMLSLQLVILSPESMPYPEIFAGMRARAEHPCARSRRVLYQH